MLNFELKFINDVLFLWKENNKVKIVNLQSETKTSNLNVKVKIIYDKKPYVIDFFKINKNARLMIRKTKSLFVISFSYD